MNRKEKEDLATVKEKGLYPELGDVIRGKMVTRNNKTVPIIDRSSRLIDLHIELAKQAVEFTPVRGSA